VCTPGDRLLATADISNTALAVDVFSVALCTLAGSCV
jgi:hypothetical protein